MTNKDIATRVNKIAREIRLENEDNYGRLRSKTWDERPSNRQARRKVKEVLKNFGDYEDLDEVLD